MFRKQQQHGEIQLKIKHLPKIMFDLKNLVLFLLGNKKTKIKNKILQRAFTF